MERQCRKAYVSVNVAVDEERTVRPRFIRWKNGLISQIDQILYKHHASSKMIGDGGIRQWQVLGNIVGQYNHCKETHKGVAVEYIPNALPA